MRAGWTPTWGAPATSWVDGGTLATPATGQGLTLPVHLTAPAVPRTYHPIAAFGPEQNAAQLLSATSHLDRGGLAIWGDGNDIATWDFATLATANDAGRVCALSNVEYAIAIKDTITGRTRSYENPWGNLGSVADIQALAPSATAPREAAAPSPWMLDAHAFSDHDSPVGPGGGVSPRNAGETELTWNPEVVVVNQPVQFQDTAPSGTLAPLRTWTFQPLDPPGEPALVATANQSLSYTFGTAGTWEVTLKVTELLPPMHSALLIDFVGGRPTGDHPRASRARCR